MINALDGVCDAAEVFQIHVLVVTQHLCVWYIWWTLAQCGQAHIDSLVCRISTLNLEQASNTNNDYQKQVKECMSALEFEFEN